MRVRHCYKMGELVVQTPTGIYYWKGGPECLAWHIGGILGEIARLKRQLAALEAVKDGTSEDSAIAGLWNSEEE